jgi:uncharacterized membrane protein YhaH (DUF805 family)
MEWMILPLKRYAQFSGRSCRREYWMFVLFTFIVSIVLSLIDATLGLGGHTNSYSTTGANGYAAGAGVSGGWLANIWSLAMFIPSLAVGVRRLHDLNRTGWWLLAPIVIMVIGFVMFFMAMRGALTGAGMGGSGMIGGILLAVGGIMSIVLLVWFCMRGTEGPNRFGPDPYAPIGDLHETFR